MFKYVKFYNRLLGQEEIEFIYKKNLIEFEIEKRKDKIKKIMRNVSNI